MGFPIWGDEAFVAVNFFMRDYADMVDPLIYGQIVPLGFMWASLAITQALGYSDWALRLLPFAAGLAAVPLFWRFATTVLKPRAAFVAVGIFAAAYYAVRHGNELKPYSLDLLISLGLMMLAWGVYRRPQSISRWIALDVLAAVSPWCSYPSVFVSGSVGLLLMLLAFRAKFRRSVVVGWMTFAIVSVGSFGWMYLVYGHPHTKAAAELAEAQMWAWTFPPVVEFWKLPAWFFLIHTGNLLAYPIGGRAPGSIVTFVLVLIGSIHLWRRDRALLLLLLGPLALTFVAAALHRYPYGGSARTSQYLAPAFCVLAGLGLYTVMRKYLAGPRLAVSLRLVGVVCAVIVLVGLGKDCLQPYKSIRDQRSQSAVRVVADLSARTDRWIVFNATEEVPYAPYVRKLKGTGAQFVFNVLRFHPGGLSWAPRPETVHAEPREENVWLLAYRGAKVEFPEDLFEDYLAKLTKNLGPPVDHRDLFIREREGKTESLIVYKFSP